MVQLCSSLLLALLVVTALVTANPVELDALAKKVRNSIPQFHLLNLALFLHTALLFLSSLTDTPYETPP